MPLGPQIITFGNIQSTFVLSLTITPAATGAATTLEQTFTVPGLQLQDQISGITPQFAYSSLVSLDTYRVSAPNVLAIAFSNGTAGSLTAPAGLYYVEVNRPYPGLVMTAIQ